MKLLALILLLAAPASAQSPNEAFVQGLIQGMRQGAPNQYQWLVPSLEQQQIQKQNRYLDELTMQQQLMNIERRTQGTQEHNNVGVPVIPLQGSRPHNCVNVGVSVVCN